MNRKEAIEKYQCPGCVCGMNTDCGSYKPSTYGSGCNGHVCGTIATGIGRFNLGLPKGFTRLGPIDASVQTNNIRIFESVEKAGYDKFNVPVWAMELEGDLHVRCYQPRRNYTYSDVIIGGKLSELSLSPINVGDFIDEMD